MKRFAILPVVAIAMAVAASARADTLVGGTGAGWQAFPTTLNSSSSTRPFWDNGSMDGTNLNIGNYLKGPFTGATSPGITPNWWGKVGTTSTNADTNMHFAKTGATDTGALQLEVAGNAAINTVGWYDEANPADKHVLWTGAATPTSGASATFTPSAAYGFYIIGGNGTFYTDSSLNTGSDAADQHFAVFANSLTAGSEKYTIGIEDLPAFTFPTEQLGDYNDFVFTVQSAGSGSPPTPEPASIGLLGAGATGLLLRRRKRS